MCESGRNVIYFTAFPVGGAKWQISNDGGADARWRRDGKELFFLNVKDDIMAVDVSTVGNAVKLVGLQRQGALRRYSRRREIPPQSRQP